MRHFVPKYIGIDATFDGTKVGPSCQLNGRRARPDVGRSALAGTKHSFSLGSTSADAFAHFRPSCSDCPGHLRALSGGCQPIQPAETFRIICWYDHCIFSSCQSQLNRFMIMPLQNHFTDSRLNRRGNSRDCLERRRPIPSLTK